MVEVDRQLLVTSEGEAQKLELSKKKGSVLQSRDGFHTSIVFAWNFYPKKCVIFDNKKLATKQCKHQNRLKYTNNH